MEYYTFFIDPPPLRILRGSMSGSESHPAKQKFGQKGTFWIFGEMTNWTNYYHSVK